MLQIDVSTLKNQTTEPLWQWDINQKIRVDGLTDNILFHFSNKKSVRAIVVESVLEDDVFTVDIPNIVLEEPYDITVYGYYDGQTQFEIHIPIVKRIQPDEV